MTVHDSKTDFSTESLGVGVGEPLVRNLAEMMEEFEKTHHEGRFGSWYWDGSDCSLNLVPPDFGSYTVKDPFYWIEFGERINGIKDMYFWISHLEGKNKNVYGQDVVEDLLYAFKELMRAYCGSYNVHKWPSEVSGKKVGKAYNKLINYGRVSKKRRFEVLERDSFTCQLCGAKAPDATLHVDHKHPRSKGGSNQMSNLWTLCSTCNIGKSDRIVPGIL